MFHKDPYFIKVRNLLKNNKNIYFNIIKNKIYYITMCVFLIFLICSGISY